MHYLSELLQLKDLSENLEVYQFRSDCIPGLSILAADLPQLADLALRVAA